MDDSISAREAYSTTHDDGNDDYDLFGKALLIEEKYYKDGYEEGVKDGLIENESSKLTNDAKDTGQREGSTAGLDIGFIRGYALVSFISVTNKYCGNIQIKQNENEMKIKEISGRILDLIDSIPLHEPFNEESDNKVKKAQALLKVLTVRTNATMIDLPSRVQQSQATISIQTKRITKADLSF